MIYEWFQRGSPLRHTFAVGMIKSQAPITELSERLGHTDIKITQTYTKEIMGDENPYGEKLTSRFGIKRKGSGFQHHSNQNE